MNTAISFSRLRRILQQLNDWTSPRRFYWAAKVWDVIDHQANPGPLWNEFRRVCPWAFASGIPETLWQRYRDTPEFACFWTEAPFLKALHRFRWHLCNLETQQPQTSQDVMTQSESIQEGGRQLLLALEEIVTKKQKAQP